MLSLLSRIVTGGDSEQCSALSDNMNSLVVSDSSSLSDDTDEVVNQFLPTTNIDQTQLVEAAKHKAQTSLIQSNSLEDIGEGTTVKTVPVVLPSQDVCRRILELVEYYLSDHNLVKDMFLLKHVTKHHEGYISLKLITSYKKIKRLTKDWRVVAHALKHSKTLEMNDEETKVRRQNALPQKLEEDTRTFRTLLATNISKEQANMNNLAEFFARFGEITSLQLHKPGGRSIEEVRQAERQHPGIINTFCAIVEYEKVHYARHALKFIINNPQCSMKTLELPRKKHETGSLLKTKANAEGESAYYSTSDVSERTSPISRMKAFCEPLSLSSSIASCPILSRHHCKPQLSSPESSPPSSYSPPCGPSTPSSSPEDRPLFLSRYEVPGSSPLPRRHLGLRNINSTPCSPNVWRRRNLTNNAKVNDTGSPAPLSPWLRRRVATSAGSFGSGSTASSPSASPSLRRRQDGSVLVPENVTRFPKGPDGSRGFLPRQQTMNAQA
ncbi:hypothetical protein OTU49_009202 [Cherax quadricarinatus]|uniref:La-related protein 6 n=1 Tax=Cherax quadricarinatus TaxID=27406 RepID=A0AAW0WAK5_CHEQU|nr:la-related protein 6-like [Cherax quadricarinatus]